MCVDNTIKRVVLATAVVMCRYCQHLRAVLSVVSFLLPSKDVLVKTADLKTKVFCFFPGAANLIRSIGLFRIFLR